MESSISTPVNPVFHGHIRGWAQLEPAMKNALRKAGLVEFIKKGNDYRILKEILS